MQAILITAYHKFDQLQKLTDLLSRKFEVYVHIDKRVENNFTPSNEHIHVYSVYPINWGGCNHLRAILFLMKEALKNPEIKYCHLISGDDWPVRSLDTINDHFEDNDEIDMLCTKYSDMTPEWYKICHGWQQYYHWLDRFDYKKLPTKVFVKCMVELQKLLHVNRYKQLPKVLGSDKELAQGLVWGSYPRDAVQFCLDYDDRNPKFMEWLSKAQAAEEFFFQTILANSKNFESRIKNNHYRYMNWTRKNGSYPGILDEEDFDGIRNGEWYFCRKVDAFISKELIKKLDEEYGI